MDNDLGIGSQSWGDSLETDVTSEVLNRAYSAALMAGVQDGSATRSPTRSAQPAIIRYDKAALEDATANNELPNRPCSLYFKYAKSTFDLRSLCRMSRRLVLAWPPFDVYKKSPPMLIILRLPLLRNVAFFTRNLNMYHAQLMPFTLYTFMMLHVNYLMLPLRTIYLNTEKLRRSSGVLTLVMGVLKPAFASPKCQFTILYLLFSGLDDV